MAKEKRNKTMSDIILIPFLFVIDFIKHFLIGFKFVFFDVFYDIIDNFVNNSYSNKEIKNKSIAEELVQEMKEEIASRTVKKDYYRYVGTDSNGKTVKGIISATNKSTLNNFLANEGIKATSIKKDITYNLIKKMGLDTEKELKTKQPKEYLKREIEDLSEQEQIIQIAINRTVDRVRHALKLFLNNKP